MRIDLFVIIFITAATSLAAEKKKDQKPPKAEIIVKGIDAKKVYELLKDAETEKGAEEVGTSYYSKFAKGVQCLRYRGTKDDSDAKNYECTFEVSPDGIILDPSIHY